MRFVLFAIVFLSGCSTGKVWTQNVGPIEGESLAEVSYDEFLKETRITVETPRPGFDWMAGGSLATPKSWAKLVFTKDKDGKETFGLGFGCKYHNWLFLNRCVSEAGDDLHCNKVDSHVAAANALYETLGSVVSEAFIRANSSKGLRVKLYGDRGSTVVEVPTEYFLAFTSAVDKWRSAKAPVAGTKG